MQLGEYASGLQMTPFCAFKAPQVVTSWCFLLIRGKYQTPGWTSSRGWSSIFWPLRHWLVLFFVKQSYNCVITKVKCYDLPVQQNHTWPSPSLPFSVQAVSMESYLNNVIYKMLVNLVSLESIDLRFYTEFGHFVASCLLCND